MQATFSTAELNALSADLAAAGPRVVAEETQEIKAIGQDLEDQWRANATQTAGRAGKHYPASIESKAAGLAAVIQPNASMPQGGMSFEFGSRNQPPHLDGEMALQVAEPGMPTKVEEAALRGMRGLT